MILRSLLPFAMANALTGVEMLLDAAMHVQSIVFSRGSALASALFFAPTMGRSNAAAAPTAAPGAEHREGQGEAEGPERLHPPGLGRLRQPGSPSERRTAAFFTGS